MIADVRAEQRCVLECLRVAAPLGAALCALAVAPARADDSNTQLWGTFTLNWIQSRQFTVGLDIEPRVLISKPASDPAWATLDLTPSVDYMRGDWLDMVGELHVGRTRQTDDLNTTEITPRIGFRFHILSNLANRFLNERLPKRRLVVRDYLRFEWRNLYYSNDQPDSSTFRVRNRFELQYPLNRSRVTDDRAVYGLSDVELFWTSKDLEERYASKQRARFGIGLRRSRAWTFEGQYVWDRSKSTDTDVRTTADSADDIRVRRVC